MPQVGSTMDEVRVRARVGANEGLLVLAEEQTAGRGRGGRSWAAAPGSGLLFSLLLRPTWLPPTNAFALTMLFTSSLCTAIEELTPLRPMLKWPNDLLLCAKTSFAGYAKAAGILVELELRGDEISTATIGCGLNVHGPPPAAAELRYPTTSLEEALGRPVERLALLRALLRQLDTGYIQLRAGGGAALFSSWRDRLLTLGRQVTVDTPGGLVAGLAEDVAPSGALLVRGADGSLHAVTAGDVLA